MKHRRAADSQTKAEQIEVPDEFPDVFSNKIGETNLIEHTIKLTDDTPCVQREYRILDALKEQVSKQIEQVLADGIIWESESGCAAPLVCIRKPDLSVQ